MPITQYTGKTLLQKETMSAIQKEADLLVQNKAVAGAYAASLHIKKQLSQLPKDQLASALPEYRRISTKLKALALPLLTKDEVSHLFEHNLEYIDTQSELLMLAGLKGWLASLPDDSLEQVKADFQKKVDTESPFAPKILALLKSGDQQSSQSSQKQPIPQKDDFLDSGELADIAQSAQKAEAVARPIASNTEAESISRQVYSLSGTKESEEVFAKRAVALINSRLRDIRTSAEIADYATRPFAVGGLGLSNDALESSLKLIENAYSRAHAHASAQPQPAPIAPAPQQKPVPPKANAGSVLAEKEKTAQKELDKLIKKDAPEVGLADLLKGKKSAPQKINQPVQKPSQPKPQIAPQVSQPQKSYQFSPRPQSTSTKPRLDDVTIKRGERREQEAPKVTGLSDEFASITLNDFRALGSSAQAQSNMLGKIRTLEQDSFASKIAGIQQFKQSPLYQNYLAIGNSAISGGKKLAGALADTSVNPDTMTEEEFFAIADLNAKLK